MITTRSTQEAVNDVLRGRYGTRPIYHLVTDDIGQVMSVFDQAFFRTQKSSGADIRYKSLFQFCQECKAKGSKTHEQWLKLIHDEGGSGKVIYLTPNARGELNSSGIDYLMHYQEMYHIERYKARSPSENAVRSRMVIYGRQLKLPDVLAPHVVRIEFPELTKEDFADILKYLCEATDEERRDPEFLRKVETAAGWYSIQLAGFPEYTVLTILQELMYAETREEKIRQLLRRSKIYSAKDIHGAESGHNTLADQIIREEKNKYLRTHGKLKCIPAGKKGVGLKAVLDWLEVHKENIRRSDFKSDEDITKGILLLGLPGTGKTMLAKSCASILELPLIQLDISSVLGGVVGESEHNMAQVLSDLKIAGAPCVLWIDELEKAFSGVGKDAGGGSAVLDRLFGQLLTFMQDVDRTVFLVATANSIEKLPPEFFRPGRFGAIFSLMLPTYSECVEIMQSKLEHHIGIDGGKLARNLMNICSGLSKWENGEFKECNGEDSVRFFTGADISLLVQEMTIALGLRPGSGRIPEQLEDEQIYCAMQSVVKTCRATADTNIPLTMQRAAITYIKVMEQGAIAASGEGTPICLQNYQPHKVAKEANGDDPQCLMCPNVFLPPYDKMMFRSIGKAMDECLRKQIFST